MDCNVTCVFFVTSRLPRLLCRISTEISSNMDGGPKVRRRAILNSPVRCKMTTMRKGEESRMALCRERRRPLVS